MRRVTAGDCLRVAALLGLILLLRELHLAVDRDADCTGAAWYLTTCDTTRR